MSREIDFAADTAAPPLASAVKTPEIPSKDPFRWLEEIKELWGKDMQIEAKSQFQQFRKKYPELGESVLLEVLGADALQQLQD